MSKPGRGTSPTRNKSKEQESHDDKLNKAKDRIVGIFKRFDRDGNGVLSRQEVQRLMQNIGSKVTKEEVDRVFEEIDANGNEQVEIEEFVEWVMQPGSCMLVEENGDAMEFHIDLTLKPLFAVYDVNKSGCINFEEFKELHSILQGAIHAHKHTISEDGEIHFNSDVGIHDDVDRLFQDLDADRSKTISFAEFVEWQRDAVKKAAITKTRFIELIAKLSSLLQSVHTVQDALGSKGSNNGGAATSLAKIKAPLEQQIAQVVGELYAGDESDAHRGQSVWEHMPEHICKQTLLRAHMKIPVPTNDVEKIEFLIPACVPSAESKRGFYRPWLSKVVRKVVLGTRTGEQVRKAKKKKTKPTAHIPHHAAASQAKHAAEHAKPREELADPKPAEPKEEETNAAQTTEVTTEHFYIYDENQDGIFMWLPMKTGDDYNAAMEALDPELQILAILITEANFGRVVSWPSIEKAFQTAIGLRLLREEEYQMLEELVQRFALHKLAKSHKGVDRLGDENRQKLIDHFIQKDFACEPLEAMSILTDAGLVGCNEAWKERENADWKEFKAASSIPIAMLALGLRSAESADKRSGGQSTSSEKPSE